MDSLPKSLDEVDVVFDDIARSPERVPHESPEFGAALLAFIEDQSHSNFSFQDVPSEALLPQSMPRNPNVMTLCREVGPPRSLLQKRPAPWSSTATAANSCPAFGPPPNKRQRREPAEASQTMQTTGPGPVAYTALGVLQHYPHSMSRFGDPSYQSLSAHSSQLIQAPSTPRYYSAGSSEFGYSFDCNSLRSLAPEAPSVSNCATHNSSCYSNCSQVFGLPDPIQDARGAEQDRRVREGQTDFSSFLKSISPVMSPLKIINDGLPKEAVSPAMDVSMEVSSPEPKVNLNLTRSSNSFPQSSQERRLDRRIASSGWDL